MVKWKVEIPLDQITPERLDAIFGDGWRAIIEQDIITLYEHQQSRLNQVEETQEEREPCLSTA
ncbi:MAG: hypothetical protein SF123_19675 [Chloroflexota bacterium]|nr:hypothetical protein [Chloroflexota bacterium]